MEAFKQGKGTSHLFFKDYSRADYGTVNILKGVRLEVRDQEGDYCSFKGVRRWLFGTGNRQVDRCKT